jgi:recombinational DNA repair protein RecR
MYANQKRFYTPQFSEVSAVSVRRLAWSLGVSMPKAVDQLVNKLPSLFPAVIVCASCKDNTKCKSCVFNRQSTAAVPAV